MRTHVGYSCSGFKRPAIAGGQFGAIFLLTLLAGTSAYAADASTLGAIVCNIKTNLVPYGDFIAAVAYAAGVMLIAQGAIKLKQNSENPNQAPATHAIMHLFAGAALLALPSIAVLIQNSMVGTVSASGSIGCTPGAVKQITKDAGGGADLFKNLFLNISAPLQSLMSAMCLVIGAFLVTKGLMRAAKYGTDPRAASIQVILANLLVGAVLLSAGQLMDIVMQTVFGVTTSGITTFPGINWSTISKAPSIGIDKANEVIKAVLVFVQVLGIIGFVRGWLIIKSAAEGTGQATIAQGVSFIIGGVMAVNIGGMAVILNKTFGLNILN